VRIPATTRGSGGPLRLVVVAVTAVIVSTPATVKASAVVTSTTDCVGTMTVTFSPALTPTPSASINGITLSGSGTCTGLSNGSGSWGGTATAQPGTSCAGPVVAANGIGSITLPSPTGNVAVIFAGGGATAAQTWAFTSGTDGKLVAVGFFVASPATQITSCITSGSATSFTMTGALVAVV
jgi:hypothetical protein